MTIMLTKLKNMTRNEMLRNNIVFFVGSMAVGALNYLLYPIISRVISVQEFGEVQVLINVLVQLTVLTNVVALFVVNVATNMKRIDEIRTFIVNLEAVALLLSALLAAIIFVTSPLLASSLQYDSFVPFWAIGLILLLNVPMSIRIGYLRSQKAFADTSYVQVLQSSLRLGFAIFAGLIGLSVAGIMFGLAGSLLVSVFFAIYISNRHKLHVQPLASLRAPSFEQLRANVSSLKGTGRYMVLVTVVSFSGMFLLSIDTILAKFFFNPEQAGLYGGVSVVARIIFFGTASIAGVLASTVKATDPTKLNRKRLISSILLTLAAGGIVAGIFAWQPEKVIDILVGDNYRVYAHLLPQLGIALLLMSLVNLIYTYHVAIRDMKIIAVAASGLMLTCSSLIIHRGSIDRLVSGLLIGVLLMLTVTIVWSITWHVKHLNKIQN